MPTWYCPQGCNVFETEIDSPECAACGAVMTADQDTFEQFHENKRIERMENETELGVLECGNGYFIGYWDDGGPNRISFQYWRTLEAAKKALKEGRWTRRVETSSGWDWGD